MATQLETDLRELHPAAARQASPALDRLLAVGLSPDPFALPAGEVAELQLQAAREVIAAQRGRVSVLGRRVEESGADEIATMADLVPLLFAHTVYKSYPAGFLKKGQWDRLLRWFATLSADPVDGVDLTGVTDVDDFINRLHAGGHITQTSSGTSGKVSFLDRNTLDWQVWEEWCDANFCWPHANPARKLRFYQLSPRTGPYVAVASGERNAARFSTPETTFFLTDAPMLIGDLMRAAEMRAAIADGTAMPSDIAAFEEEARAKGARSIADFDRIADEILDNRHEPMMLTAQSGMLWRLLERARARGIPDGEFHPESILATGGGAKGLKLPEDYMQQIHAFLGPVHHTMDIYGCSEMSVVYPACEHGHYHALPWIVPFVLDREGENLLSPAPGHGGGVVQGRFAFLDLSYTSRWGGLITGDRVTMDFAPVCACGRNGPVVLAGSIARYTDLGEEDKITCSGTMEAYIRGTVE